MRKAKPQRETASRLNFGQGKEKAVNKSKGTAVWKRINNSRIFSS